MRSGSASRRRRRLPRGSGVRVRRSVAFGARPSLKRIGTSYRGPDAPAGPRRHLGRGRRDGCRGEKVELIAACCAGWLPPRRARGRVSLGRAAPAPDRRRLPALARAPGGPAAAELTLAEVDAALEAMARWAARLGGAPATRGGLLGARDADEQGSSCDCSRRGAARVRSGDWWRGHCPCGGRPLATSVERSCCAAICPASPRRARRRAVRGCRAAPEVGRPLATDAGANGSGVGAALTEGARRRSR